jgi:hypothetical protein
MANTSIDVAVADFDVNDAAATAAGTVTNDVAVIIKAGADRHSVYVALDAIVKKLGAGGFTLQ